LIQKNNADVIFVIFRCCHDVYRDVTSFCQILFVLCLQKLAQFCRLSNISFTYGQITVF